MDRATKLRRYSARSDSSWRSSSWNIVSRPFLSSSMSDYVATVPLVLAGDGRFHGDAKNYAPVARTGDFETPVLAIRVPPSTNLLEIDAVL